MGIIIRTKKQSCAQVKAWAYKADDADDEDLNDGDSNYREFGSAEEAREYFEYDAELEPKNSNELWRKNVAVAAIEALADGEMRETEQDDFGLFIDGELL